MSANLLIEALGVAEAAQAERTGNLFAASRHANDAVASLLEAAIKAEPVEHTTLALLAETARLLIEAEGLPLDDVPGTAGALHAAAVRYLRRRPI